VTFESEYINLLIKQYWEKPKAAAEIEMKAGMWRRTFEWIDSFSEEFDLDNATGDRLDIIGRIVGIGRIFRTLSQKLHLALMRTRILAALMIFFPTRRSRSIPGLI